MEYAQKASIPSNSDPDKTYHLVYTPIGWRHVYVDRDACAGDFYRGWCWHTDMLNVFSGLVPDQMTVDRMNRVFNERSKKHSAASGD